MKLGRFKFEWRMRRGHAHFDVDFRRGSGWAVRWLGFEVLSCSRRCKAMPNVEACRVA